MNRLTLLLAAALLSACGTTKPSAPENAPIAVNVMWPGGRCDQLILHTTGDLDAPKIERVGVKVNACWGAEK